VKSDDRFPTDLSHSIRFHSADWPNLRILPPPVLSLSLSLSSFKRLIIYLLTRDRTRARARARHGFGSGVAWTSALAAFQRHRCSIGFISSVLSSRRRALPFSVSFVTRNGAGVRSAAGGGRRGLGDEIRRNERSAGEKEIPFLGECRHHRRHGHDCNNALVNIYDELVFKTPIPCSLPRRAS
jgi:hypothetical protein